jgi:hypothetical protein
MAGNIWAEDVSGNKDILPYSKGLAAHIEKLPFKQTHLSLSAKGFEQAVKGLREVLVYKLKKAAVFSHKHCLK